MPDEDNNFGGSLGLDFKKWWCYVQPKNTHNLLPSSLVTQLEKQQWSIERAMGSCLTLVRVFFCPCVGPILWLGLKLR